MNSKTKVILERIKQLEDAVTKAREYLESGKHADWHGFRPFFVNKVRNGELMPPHCDWVRNVFLPSREKALSENQKLLDTLTQKSKRRANQRPDFTARRLAAKSA